MRDSSEKSEKVVTLAATLLFLLLTAGAPADVSHRAFSSVPGQDTYPAPPSDRALIYVSDESNALVALPFETATTPLAVDRVAGSDKRSYVELKGERAATALRSDAPRFYLFVSDVPNTHPPFIVSLSMKRGVRRVTAMAQKGLKGFAVDSEEIIKPHYRVLGHEGGMLYMEIRPRERLLPGEYAIMGTDLQRIATFRIGAVSP
ncbi:MAG TPA: hypothetical protein VGC64_04920 [Pyrinomonadaceae bacterium]